MKWKMQVELDGGLGDVNFLHPNHVIRIWLAARKGGGGLVTKQWLIERATFPMTERLLVTIIPLHSFPG